MKPETELAGLPDELQRRSSLVLRTLPILLIPVLAALIIGLIFRFTLPARVALAGPPAEARLGPLISIVVMVIFFTALIMLVRLGKPTTSALVLIGGWTLVTTLAALRNGVTSVWPALLIMPICAAGLLLDGAASVSLAALATLLIGSIAWLQSQAIIPEAPALPGFVADNAPLLFTGFWTVLFWTIAALTSLLAGNLQRALQQSRAQAHTLSGLSQQLEGRVAEQTAELAQRTARAEALYEVNRALTSTLDLPEVLALITEQAARLLHFRASQVLLDQQDIAQFTLVGAYNAQTETNLTGLAASDEQSLRKVLEQRQPTTLTLHDDSGRPVSALVLPMHHTDQVAGLLVLLDPSDTSQPGHDDLALAEGLADQAAVAIANAQLLAQSRESAILEERARLARDIHDTLAQGLTGIVVQLGAAQRALQAAPDEVTRHLDLGQRMARESLAEARASVWNLRSPALKNRDLIDAMRRLAAHPLRPDLVVEVQQRGDVHRIPAGVETALLRVCQEALTNVARHSSATQATMGLEHDANLVRLTISDNGPGFDSSILSAPSSTGMPQGFGLLGMRERLASLGGTLTLSSANGATVVAEVPLRQTVAQPNVSGE